MNVPVELFATKKQWSDNMFFKKEAKPFQNIYIIFDIKEVVIMASMEYTVFLSQ